MKQLFQSMWVVLIALQGLACAGGAGVDAEDAEQGAAEAAEEIELSALDLAPEDVSGEELDAAEPVVLLSPSEREDQLSALTGSEVGEPGTPDVVPLENVERLNVVRSNLALSNAASRSPSLE